ncbi:DUF2271 domain-containing protein [Serratia silvae]|uniref:DUF2271 domain-containing protein n=1 Tax=Serratia silvae TaxID=2824122 RepID=A0ABT0KC62_9GAMM|nr:DUF2271 domain-containing protein [Serratia silvae]MCL1029536.1 hypothetical protein [Serratia silvae]
MKKTTVALSLLFLTACQQETKQFTHGNISVDIKTGEQWQHSFKLFWGIKVKNDPQIAIWLEDMEGRYLSTVYVSKKIATQGWIFSGGNRRKEALPYWSHKRGVQDNDGLYLPSKKAPLPDAITGATPSADFDLKISQPNGQAQFILKAEFNHSTDFNDYYPKSAKPGDAGYSGGEEGSGQPALVYQAVIDLSSQQKTFKAQLIGHSSPNGSNGELFDDLSTITSAKDIVKEIVVDIVD